MTGSAAGGFVGRRREAAELETSLDRAAAGTGGLVLVSGEAGIGKTALAHHAIGRARDRGFEVAWAACWQTAAVPALWPWTQLLAQLAGPKSEPPDLTSPTAELEKIEAARTEQAERVTRWLRHRGGQPAVLVLDDLQWADAGTLSVLTAVAAVLPALPLVVIATARPVDRGSPVFADAAPSLRRWGTSIHLAGLDVGETAELVAVTSGVVPDPVAARALRDLTGGNPLFAREVGRTLTAEAITGRFDAAALAVPGSVTDVIAERIATVSPRCRELLDSLAVTGDEATVDVLAAVLDTPPGDLLGLVDEATEAGVVDHRDDSVSFTHALFRAAVYELLSLTARARLHMRIGDALLAKRSAGTRIDAAALAHHFGRSAPLGNSGKAIAFALEAAAEAKALLSFDLAARRIEQALALVATDPALGDRLPLLLDLADARVAAGDFDGARATFAAAAAEARSVGDAVALGRAALGFSGGMAGIEVLVGDREVCDLLEEAATLLADDTVVGPLVSARLSVALSYVASSSERVQLAVSACERARTGGDPATIAQALAAWCDAFAGPDHVDARRSASTEIIDHATRCGDIRVETLGRRLLVEALLEAGELAAAETEVARFETGASRLGRSEYAWYPALWRAALAFARGDRGGHQRHRAELRRLVDETGGTNAALLASVHDIAVAFELADRRHGEQALDDIWAMDVPTLAVQFRVSVARIRSFVGDHEHPREPVAQLAVEALAADVDSEWAPMMMQLAELAADERDATAARALRERLEPYGSVWSIEGIGAGIRGPLDRVLGRLAATVGDTEAARDHFARARSAAAEAGARLIVAAIDHESGLSLDDPDRLGSAEAFWRAYGAHDRIAELAGRAIGTSVPTVNRFVADGESWSITFGGSTFSLRDSKGLRDLARLLAEPGREVAAVDLAAPDGTVVQAGTGDVIDATARDSYRARLVEIEAELDEADLHADLERSALLAAERDALVGELARGYGLGGRARQTGRTAERARTAVRARIRDALDRIEAANPPLGRHLRRSVRTGFLCVYDPEPHVQWEV